MLNDLEAGVAFSELIDFADRHGLTIPSGGDLSVGSAGGYPQARLPFISYSQYLLSRRAEDMGLLNAWRSLPSSLTMISEFSPTFMDLQRTGW
jgi:hypothetical protein